MKTYKGVDEPMRETKLGLLRSLCPRRSVLNERKWQSPWVPTKAGLGVRYTMTKLVLHKSLYKFKITKENHLEKIKQ